MNSFAYDSFHSPLFRCFASNNDDNEETIPKDLIKAVEGHQN